MSEVKFKCTSLQDNSIYVYGVFDTDDAENERPIQWIDYGLRRFFPNNPYDPNWEIADYNRYEDFRNAVLTDELLIQFLVDFADDDDVEIMRNGYKLSIGNEGD